MLLGVCTGFENRQAAFEAGFDYLECSVSAAAGMDEGAFKKLIRQDFPLPVLRANGMVPGNIKICGPDADECVQREYLSKAFSRIHALGVEIAVFGSGAARNVPQGFPFAQAWRQIIHFLETAAEIAEKNALRIAVEPLRRQESNIINLVSEGVLLSALVHAPQIGVLGDTFHMLSVGEPLDALSNAGERLLHMHVSRPLEGLRGREYPYAGDGEDYSGILKVLNQMHYRGTISIEANVNDFSTEAPRAVECLKPLMQR